MTTTTKPQKLQIASKPNLVKLAQDIDFFELFKRIEAKYDTCFLLESLGEESYIARHHAIGFDPAMTVLAKDRHTLTMINNRTGASTDYTCDNPYELLREITPQHVISRSHTGGLVGFLGFDSVNFFEPTLNIQTSDDFEPFKFGVYLDGLSLDKMTGEIFYYYYDTVDQSNRIDEIKSLLTMPSPNYPAPTVKHLGDGMNREQHATAVMKVKEDIKAGLIFQCEVGFKSHYQIQGDTMPIYSKLREVNPSPHMYYVKFGEQKIIGASPELLFRLRNGEMETFPLAGTDRKSVV